MDKIEEALNNHKNTIEAIEAPLELEAHLRAALEHTSKPRRWPMKGISVAVLLLVMLTVYSYDAIAYYGKQLLGYDQVISGSLKDLNRLGKGQELGKSYTFSDGSAVILDKILFDDNELILLYTEKANKQVTAMSPNYNHVRIEMKGLWGMYFPQGGKGVGDKDGGQISWVQSFDPPKPFEKWMNFTVSKNVNGVMETAKIPFTLDRNEAIINTVKQDLTESIEIDGKQINFNNITATPMSTVIKGTADNFNQDEYLSFDLMVDGKKVLQQGRGLSGNNLEWEFDGISEVHSLKIANIKLVRERMINSSTPVTPNIKNLEIGTGDDLFVIKEVLVKNGNTYLRIKRNNNVEASLGVFNGDEQLMPIIENVSKEGTNDTKVKVIEEIRGYKGSGDDLKIDIKIIQSYTFYEGNLEIPVM